MRWSRSRIDRSEEVILAVFSFRSSFVRLEKRDIDINAFLPFPFLFLWSIESSQKKKRRGTNFEKF